MHRSGRSAAAVAVLLSVLTAACNAQERPRAPQPPAAASDPTFSAPTPTAPPSLEPPVPADALPQAPAMTDAFAKETVVSAIGGLADEGVSALRRDPAVAQVVDVRTGALWVASGLPLHPEIPVEAVAVDSHGFADASGEPGLAALLEAGAVLSETSAALRDLGAGDRVPLADGRTLPVSGVVDDAAVGGYEIALSAGTGREFGVARTGYLLVRPTDYLAAGALEAAVRRAFEGQVVRIRPPGERPFARQGDEVLPQALIKALFGEFAVRRTGTRLEQDPAWTRANIVEADVPLLGRFRCHRRLLDALIPAMEEVAARGLESTVRGSEFAGCYAVRTVRGASSVSRHAWGAAVDLNAVSNPLGAAPRIDARLITVLETHGLRWGGRFLRPDGQHFEGYGR